MSPCPSDEQLEAYLTKPPDEAFAAEIAGHIESCSSCAVRVQAFQTDQSLVRAVRRVMDGDPAGADNETETIESVPVSAAIPAAVGQYHLKRVIASGGMGTVYEAVQQSPRRTVAVKVMKKGIASRSALRRFVYESQVLARLRHPGIAQVFEAGVQGEGDEAVPFFAMEYIPNARPITEFARLKELHTRERLLLFVQVCEAVHHGHEKGVIHRDLKPSNILVDSTGQVKIIDFGVARSTDSDLAITTLQTDVGQLIGTLQYMSPEQCDADPHDIDTRSDVYALGVVLYELLCGKMPYDLTRMPVYEATRVIREHGPARPSTIKRTLRGDVETIAMKALEKNRERRYRSAADLGDDIRRYMAGEAITACPPTMAYLLWVFARKHRVIVGSAALIFVVLTTALITTSVLYRRADQARVLAEQGQKQAKAVTDFLTDTLSSIEPDKAVGREVAVRELVDKTAGEIDKAFAGQPLVEATIRTTLGKTYTALAIYTDGEAQLLRALELRKQHLGESSLPVAESLSLLGTLQRIKGEYGLAEASHRKALAIRKSLLGGEHLDVASSMNELGIVLVEIGAYVEANSLLRQALSIRRRSLHESNPLVAQSLNNMGRTLKKMGNYRNAERLYREALDVWRSYYGDDHPEVATGLANLGALLYETGDITSAERFLRQAVETARKAYPLAHQKLASSLSKLGAVLVAQRNFAEAAQVLQESFSMYQSLYTELPPNAASPLSFLAEIHLLEEDFDGAWPLLQQAFEIRLRGLTSDNPNARATAAEFEKELLRVAGLYEMGGHLERAETVRRQAKSLAPESRW